MPPTQSDQPRVPTTEPGPAADAGTAVDDQDRPARVGIPVPASADPDELTLLDDERPAPESVDRPIDPRRLRAGPLSRFLLVLAVLAVAGAIVVTMREPPEVPVFVATRGIPAYHVITSDDVKLGTRSAESKADYAGLPAERRIALTAIAEGQPLRQSQVAPDIAAVFPGELTVHGFSVPSATALDGALRAGDRIQLLLVRDGERLPLVGEDGTAIDRLDAIVLSVTKAGQAATLVVVLPADQAKDNEVAIGTGTIVVFKDPAARNATG
jgi:hypothetical protein